jgi:membrane-associated PAP2 superfamily phosphatase
MNATGGRVASYRRYWVPEAAVLVASAAAMAILFSTTDLDIVAARRFYHPERSAAWPVADEPLWRLFYRSAPWVTGSLSVAGVAALLSGMVREKWREFRWHGLFLLLCVAIGPGLIVNGILKDHWGRPRPRQIVEFGGRLAYTPPLVPSGQQGKSFPCGHCSVGYLYGAGWWIWRRSRPRWGAVSLAAGSAVGTLEGLGRMAAGGHFLSDVAWSGWIAFGVAHVLYYHALRIPAREDSPALPVPRIGRDMRARPAAVAAAVLLGAGIVGGGILATPHDKDLSARIRLADYPELPETFEVIVGSPPVEIVLVPGPPAEIECAGSIHGFGPPTSRIRVSWEFERLPVPTLRYRVSETGWFTDIDGIARIRLPARNLRRIAVRAGRGDITVIDATGGDSTAGPLPEMDLQTGGGRVRRP